MNPSIISGIYPWSSVMQNSECEVVARNIMVILERTGDRFRELTAEEYEHERKKDGAFSYTEAQIFDRVKKVATSAIMAANFCKGWAEALDAAKETA